MHDKFVAGLERLLAAGNEMEVDQASALLDESYLWFRLNGTKMAESLRARGS